MLARRGKRLTGFLLAGVLFMFVLAISGPAFGAAAAERHESAEPNAVSSGPGYVFGAPLDAQPLANINEGFEGTLFPPDGWVAFRGANGLGTLYDWTRSTTTPHTGVAKAFVRYENVTGGLAEDWLATPRLRPDATNYTLSFWMKQDFSSNYGSIYTARVSTASQTSYGDYTIVATWDETQFSTTWQQFNVDLSAYTNQSIYVAFVMTNDDGDNFSLDDVTGLPFAPVDTPPACATIVSPADGATNVSALASLNWASGGGAPTGYKLSFDTVNPPGNQQDLGNVTTYDPPGSLAFSTTYYWQVIPYNDNGDASGCAVWSFTTEPDPTVVTFPYTVDFGAPSCVIPSGWSNDPTNLENWLFGVPGNNADPAQYGADADHTTGTGCIAWINDSSPDSANPAYLVSPPMDLSGLGTPKMSFWYQNIDGGSSGATSILHVDVYDGTMWHDDVLTVNTPLDNWTEFTVNLAAYKSVETRVRFQSNEQVGDFDSDPSLDDIMVFDDTAPNFSDSTKSVDHVYIPVGDDATYTLVIQNTGGGSATDVVLADPIPAGATYVDGSLQTLGGPPDATYDSGSNQIEWTVGSFAPGAVVTITYDATISGPGPVVNSASLTSSNTAPVMLQATVNTCQGVSSYPYAEGFEADAGGWSSGGVLNSWELGTPADTVINSAYEGVNAWKTRLNGDYSNSEQSYVISPCFDFSSLVDPVVELTVWWESEAGWDGAKLQASVDSGQTWLTVGAFGDPNNWYNNNSVDGLAWTGNIDGWSGRTDTGTGSNGYKVARHSLTGLGGQSQVLLRVAFGSDASVVDEGIAFDMVQVREALNVSKSVDDVTPMSGQTLTYTVVLHNDGNADATDVALSDSLPAELAYVDGSVAIDPPSAGVVGAPPTLASSVVVTAGTAVTVTYQATLEFGLATGTMVSNAAEVSSPVYTTPLTAAAGVTVDTLSSEVLSIAGAGVYYFNAGVVTVEVTNDGGCLTGLQVDRTETDHPSAPNSSLMTGRYWSFTPLGCTSGFMVNLTLPASFPVSDASVVCRWDGSGNLPEDWDCAATAYDTGNGTITRDGVTQFSDWLAGKKTPLAINLRVVSAASNPPATWVLLTLFVGSALLGWAWRQRRQLHTG